jgi:hypothetical protein
MKKRKNFRNLKIQMKLSPKLHKKRLCQNFNKAFIDLSEFPEI